LGWGVGQDLEGEVKAFVGPQAAERYNVELYLADLAQVLAGQVIGLDSRFAVPTVIQDEDPSPMRFGAGGSARSSSNRRWLRG